MRPVRRWRLLLAHDATARTCDPLVESIEGALGNVDISESSSIEDSRVALHTGRFDVGLVCLDLPPAPLGGVRLAQEMVRRGLPVVLVTRSLRWIPASATTLRDLPWLPPDAGTAQVARAVGEAMAAFGGRAEEEGAPSTRPSLWKARAVGDDEGDRLSVV